jgi:hypothetical protein
MLFLLICRSNAVCINQSIYCLYWSIDLMLFLLIYRSTAISIDLSVYCYFYWFIDLLLFLLRFYIKLSYEAQFYTSANACYRHSNLCNCCSSLYTRRSMLRKTALWILYGTFCHWIWQFQTQKFNDRTATGESHDLLEVPKSVLYLYTA